MGISRSDKLAIIGLIIGIVAIVVPIALGYVSENEQMDTFQLIKKTTVNRLAIYKEILHKEKRPLFDAKKKEINDLLSDSIEYIDENLILMLNNNSNRIESWKTKHNSDDYYFSINEFKEENIILEKENKELYLKVCKKYKLTVDTTFFKRYSFY